MTAPTVAPVIPSPGRLTGVSHVRPGAVRPLPMAGPADALAVPEDVVYGTGRIDASGRVTDQAVSCALGWCEEDRLTLTASPGIVTARRDPGGMACASPRLPGDSIFAALTAEAGFILAPLPHVRPPPYSDRPKAATGQVTPAWLSGCWTRPSPARLAGSQPCQVLT